MEHQIDQKTPLQPEAPSGNLEPKRQWTFMATFGGAGHDCHASSVGLPTSFFGTAAEAQAMANLASKGMDRWHPVGMY